MPIRHKFYQTNFGNGFATNSAILDVTPYEPQVMFIGTFNPDTPNTNAADFFYGRNFFWTGFKNLFTHNQVGLTKRRIPQRGAPALPLNPTLNEIFQICIDLKLTFADLISGTMHHNNPTYNLLANDNVDFNGITYNLIQDGSKKNIRGLEQLDDVGQVHWNTTAIINFLCNNPRITTIYFTRRPTGIWANQWNAITNSSCVTSRLLTNIFTPSGQGRPVSQSMTRLLNHWVHNVNPNFGQLDNNWLMNNGVTLTNF